MQCREKIPQLQQRSTMLPRLSYRRQHQQSSPVCMSPQTVSWIWQLALQTFQHLVESQSHLQTSYNFYRRYITSCRQYTSYGLLSEYMPWLLLTIESLAAPACQLKKNEMTSRMVLGIESYRYCIFKTIRCRFLMSKVLSTNQNVGKIPNSSMLVDLDKTHHYIACTKYVIL